MILDVRRIVKAGATQYTSEIVILDTLDRRFLSVLHVFNLSSKRFEEAFAPQALWGEQSLAEELQRGYPVAEARGTLQRLGAITVKSHLSPEQVAEVLEQAPPDTTYVALRLEGCQAAEVSPQAYRLICGSLSFATVFESRVGIVLREVLRRSSSDAVPVDGVFVFKFSSLHSIRYAIPKPQSPEELAERLEVYAPAYQPWAYIPAAAPAAAAAEAEPRPGGSGGGGGDVDGDAGGLEERLARVAERIVKEALGDGDS